MIMETVAQALAVTLLAVAGWVGLMLWRERHRRLRDHDAEVVALARQQRAARFEDRTVEVAAFRNAEEAAAHRARRWVIARRAFEQEHDRVAARRWQTDYDATIADQDARWRALCARWDAEWAGLPPAAGSDGGTAETTIAPNTTPTDVLPALAQFDPAATLNMIKRDNAVPTVFSWTTKDHPVVSPGVIRRTTRDQRRLRRLARHAANPLPR